MHVGQLVSSHAVAEPVNVIECAGEDVLDLDVIVEGRSGGVVSNTCPRVTDQLQAASSTQHVMCT